MKYIKYLITFIIGSGIGFFLLLKYNSSNVLKISQENKVDINLTVKSIIKNSDFYSLKYTDFMFPEIKNKMQSNDNEKIRILATNEKFWENFKLKKLNTLQEIDNLYITRLEDSLKHFSGSELVKYEKYLNMPEVVKIKGQINIYMKNEYFKDSNSFQQEIEELILKKLLNKKEEQENGQKTN